MARFADDIYNPVPTVTPQTGMPEDYLQAQGSPQAFGAQVGAAEQGLGKTLEGAGQDFAQTALYFQQIDNETVANKAVQQYADFTANAEKDLRMKQGQNAISAYPQFQKDMKDQLDNIAGGIAAPAAKLAFYNDARNFYNRSMYSSGLYVGDEAKRGVVESYKGKIQTIDNFTTLHFNDPHAIADGINKTVDATLALAHQMGIADKDAVNGMVTEYVGNMVDNAITAQLSQGTTLRDQLQSAKMAKAMLSSYEKTSIPGSPGVPILDARHLDQLSSKINYRDLLLQNKVDRQEDVAAAHTAVTVEHSLSDAQLKVENGLAPGSVPTDAQIQFAWKKNPEMAAYKMQQAHDIIGMSQFTGQLANATPDQVERMRQEAYPDPNKPDFTGQMHRYNAFVAVTNRRNTILNKDPVDYLQKQNPELAQAFQDGIHDPSKFPAYVQAIQTRQTSMGLPAWKQHVLGQGQAQAIANDIQSDPTQSANKLAQYQKTFGWTWPTVFKDISGMGGLPIQYQALTDLDKPDANLLSRAMTDAHNGKDLTKALPPVPGPSGKDIPGSTYIKNEIQSDNDLRSFTSRFTTSGASPEQVDGIYNTVNTLAQAYVYYNGMKPDEAVQKAKTALIGKTQPFSQGTIPSDKFYTMSNNATMTVNGLNPGMIQIPQGVQKPIENNLSSAQHDLKLTPQENYLYQHHLTNLSGSGKVLQPTGEISTILQESVEKDGKVYNIPTVWDGKVLSNHDALLRAEKEGLDKFPSYRSEKEAEDRYQQMHQYMDKDVGNYLKNTKSVGVSTEEYMNDLKANHYWTTSPHNDSLWLHDGSGRFVRDRTGNPVSLPFNAPPMINGPAAEAFPGASD